MEISIVQAILIALWSGFCLAGMLLGIYTNRCLVMATGVGIILGRPDLGLAMGALGELAYLGYGVSQGGSIPPNAMGPGIVGAIMVITAGVMAVGIILVSSTARIIHPIHPPIKVHTK